MQIILLSGGSGQRLWPLSNDVYSKQFLKIFDGGECMLQRVLKQIRRTNKGASITIAAARKQEPLLKKYIAENFDISSEPCRRNTFPAIALAAAYLRDVKKVSADEAIIVCPVDPYVDDNFFAQFPLLAAQVETSPLVLMGIAPTYPSEKYGYIIPQTTEKISRVKMFKEKPALVDAQKFIAAGGLWNGGVFALKLGYILDKAEKLLGTASHDALKKNYDALPNISFDYAVVEHEENISVVRYVGEWKDIGTWNTLTEVLKSPYSGGGIQADQTCKNLHIINSGDVPIICMGLKDIVVAAAPEGILVADKVASSYIKPFVEKLDRRIRFAEKSWGSFKIIDVEPESLTVKVTLNRGSRMRYHSHTRRDEVWNFIEGAGRIILDGAEKIVRAGDVIKIPCGVRHTVIADDPLKIIEVQFGKDITVDDKIIWQEEI